jgi:hypothetical protein
MVVVNAAVEPILMVHRVCDNACMSADSAFYDRAQICNRCLRTTIVVTPSSQSPSGIWIVDSDFYEGYREACIILVLSLK